jgi:hypothetical protein
MSLKPKIKPKINKAGIKSQPRNIASPKKNIKASKKTPKRIKKVLIAAPMTREIRFEKKTLIYLPMSNPPPLP